jgi:multidrug efflux system outer membrane protein
MMRKAAWLFGMLAIAGGCGRPHYEPQYVNIPEEWRFSIDDGDTLCNARWWEELKDPVLNELILIALRNNQDLRVAIARVCEYYAKLGITNANMYPFVNGNAAFSRSQSSLATPLGSLDTTALPGLPRIPRIYNDFLANFSLAWQLDFWGQLASATEAAYAEYLGSIEARRSVLLTVVISTAQAYIQLRSLDAQLQVAIETRQSREESLKLAISRFNLGETSELEVVQAEAELEIAVLRQLEFERDIPIQENQLSVLLGQTPRSVERGSSIGAFEYPLSIPAGLPSDLLYRRPDIIQAEDSLIAANARVSEARALFFPQINLTGFYGNESDHLHKLFTSPANAWQWGLAALQPIYNSGQIYYQVEEATAIRNEALFAYRQVIIKAFAEVDSALIAYHKNLELVAENQKQVKILTEYVKLATLRYDEGEVDYLNVLDAQRALFDAQLELIQAQANSFDAVIELYGALGGGWVLDADALALKEYDVEEDQPCCEEAEDDIKEASPAEPPSQS